LLTYEDFIMLLLNFHAEKECHLSQVSHFKCWIHVSETVDEEAADKEAADEETADVESADVEAVMSFSFNKTLAIWISQFLLGLI